jgi:hypothetical protein
VIHGYLGILRHARRSLLHPIWWESELAKQSSKPSRPRHPLGLTANLITKTFDAIAFSFELTGKDAPPERIACLYRVRLRCQRCRWSRPSRSGGVRPLRAPFVRGEKRLHNSLTWQNSTAHAFLPSYTNPVMSLTSSCALATGPFEIKMVGRHGVARVGSITASNLRHEL